MFTGNSGGNWSPFSVLLKMGLITHLPTYRGHSTKECPGLEETLKRVSSEPSAMHRDTFLQTRFLRAPSKVVTEAPYGGSGEKPLTLVYIALYPKTEIKDKGIPLHGGAFYFQHLQWQYLKQKWLSSFCWLKLSLFSFTTNTSVTISWPHTPLHLKSAGRRQGCLLPSWFMTMVTLDWNMEKWQPSTVYGTIKISFQVEFHITDAVKNNNK